MSEHFRAPATLRPLRDIVAEYEAKRGEIPAALQTFKQQTTDLETAANIGGAYGGNLWSGGRYSSAPNVGEAAMQSTLLKSAWRHVMAGLNISKIATAKDKSALELSMENPPEFTLDNIRATFGKYLIDPRTHILRGVAEAFCELDPAFKSHSKMKVGVAGLPKRVIMSNALAEYGGWKADQLADVLNAVSRLHGEPRLEYAELDALLKAAKRGDDPELFGMTLRGFANGNCHIFFDREAQDHINRALAEYYGDVLPDTPDEPKAKQPGTDLAKDLQFYPTPAAAAKELVDRAHLVEGMAVLEPSCGTGNIMDALRDKQPRLRVTGVECHAGRAEEARAKGHHVQTANLLQIAPSPVFDLVLMNPPFYGKHYQKHVEHARRFLKPDGAVYAILPITAVTDHGYIEPGRGWDKWKDLPVGTFSESGTNINTGIARFFAP